MTPDQKRIAFWSGALVLIALLFWALDRANNTTTVNQGDIIGGSTGDTILELAPSDFALGDLFYNGGARPQLPAPRRCSSGPRLLVPGTVIPITLTPPAPRNFEVARPYVPPSFPDSPPEMPDNFTPVIPRTPPPAPLIHVFKDSNYRSKKLSFTGPVANMNTTGLGLNDGISSIQVTGIWEVFEHANFQGRSKIVDTDIPNLYGDYLQDKISSMRPI